MSRPRSFHIEIDAHVCIGCAGCVSICPTRALDMHGLELACQDALCIGCDLCVRFCPVVALALEDRMIPASLSHEAESIASLPRARSHFPAEP